MNVLARIGPRLAATFALVAALGVAISSVIVYRTTAADLRGRLRENTVTRLEAAADLFGASERLVAGARVDDPGLPPALRRAAAPNRAVSYFDGQHMWAVQRFPGRGVLSVSQPADTDRAFLDRLVRLFTMAGLAAALVATLVGAFIAARISRRLARIGTVAQAAASGRFEQRVGDRGRDQVGDLARAVDAMAADLGARMEREQRFAADVAHELRTPVAALVSASELLDDPRGREIAREQVARLRRLVDDLLETFRAQKDGERAELEPVDLGGAVRTACEQYGGRVRVDAGDGGTVEAEPRRLVRVVDNLVSNALRYGAPPVVVAVRDGDRVEVRDAGPGFPDWLVAQGPQRFRTESASRGDGIGLGLTIAASLAASMGATLTLSNDPRGGAVASVAFSRAAAPEAA
ncbi:MAG: HAMP domain-containing histidine kinase [Thermoleophilia bacterium]|nr:HAMP domain-containing histidine kinase [Thermoleophilia bacterium]